MSVAPQQRIIQTVIDRLRLFTRENDFEYDVVGVVQPDHRGEGWTPQHRLIVVDGGSNTRRPEHDRPGNPPSICYTLIVESKMIFRPGEKADPMTSSEMWYAAAAMQMLIAADSHWWQFGGVSFHADHGDPVPFIATSGEYSGILVPTAVWYRVSDNNQFEIRS